MEISAGVLPEIQRRRGKEMTEQELQRLNRKDLLEIMVEQGRELEALKKELNEAKEALQSREIALDEAGSIAVAALQINGIFEVAQAASQQYIENIKKLNERQTAICAQREAESRGESRPHAERRCRKMPGDGSRSSTKM